MKIFFNTCAIAAVLLALIYFAMQNSQEVTITYYEAMADSFPLWSAILIPFFAGVIAGNMLDMLKRFRLGREVKKLRRELKSYEASSNSSITM